MEDEKKSYINVEEEMKRSYLDYAMSVIVGRALPDVRDGLKPVHRRVLYAMHETGNTGEKPYRKSARTVGTVIGRYHPHGDSAVYDTIVRLAQDFSMRYPLVDGQGNFGSVDGDRAAAMRYTEIKLQKLAHEMLRDIDKETVDFSINYDGSETEPTVLPAAIPNLLINGSAGIAVGMATNVPPHNLGEVIAAIKLVVDNPAVDLDELMQVLPGPDFPTAGLIQGTLGIRQAYATGRGRIRLRARTLIEPHPRQKDREVIVVTELPYQVNKAQLIIDIAHLVRDKRIEGISDIRDESDRDGIRMVIELKRGEIAQVVLNKLYKYTKLQTTFGVINLALVNGRPQLLPVKDMLRHFVNFRREVVVRRTHFDLRKAEARAHILEGLKIAIDNLDEVVRLIRASKTPPEAHAALVARFEFSDLQAKAILEMRLQRLTGLERQKIIDEYEEMLKLIEQLKQILASDALQFKIVLEELDAIREKFADERRSEIVHTDDEITTEDLVKKEDVVVTMTHTGYIKRTALDSYESQRRGGKGRIATKTKDEDAVQHLFVGSTHDYILAFTSAGRVHWLKVFTIPDMGRYAKGRSIANLIRLQPDEKVQALLSVSEFADDQFVVFATRNGIIKKTPLEAFSRPRAAGIIALSIDEDDRLLAASLSGGDDEIFMATALGKSIRFSEKDVRAMGRSARGVMGVRLGKGDKVVAAEVLSGRPDILTVTQNGYGKRTPVTGYRHQGRGGSGIINMKTSERNGHVVGAMGVNDDDQLLLVTASGKIIRMSVDGISKIGRATQGVKVIQTAAADQVVSAIRTAEAEVTDDDGADESENKTEQADAAAEE
jgi:DNA gyrase subunit A